LTANKKYEIDYQTVLGTVGFSSGSGGHSRHYWEIKLDTFVDMEDIVVGIARRGSVELRVEAWLSMGSFWGWICTG
jgi:tripartite motif-containing protein 9/67